MKQSEFHRVAALLSMLFLEREEATPADRALFVRFLSEVAEMPDKKWYEHLAVCGLYQGEDIKA